MKTARLARWLLFGVLLAGIAAAMIYRGGLAAGDAGATVRGPDHRLCHQPPRMEQLR